MSRTRAAWRNSPKVLRLLIVSSCACPAGSMTLPASTHIYLMPNLSPTGYKHYGLNPGTHEGKTGIWYREWAPGARVRCRPHRLHALRIAAQCNLPDMRAGPCTRLWHLSGSSTTGTPSLSIGLLKMTLACGTFLSRTALMAPRPSLTSATAHPCTTCSFEALAPKSFPVPWQATPDLYQMWLLMQDQGEGQG